MDRPTFTGPLRQIGQCPSSPFSSHDCKNARAQLLQLLANSMTRRIVMVPLTHHECIQFGTSTGRLIKSKQTAHSCPSVSCNRPRTPSANAHEGPSSSPFVPLVYRAIRESTLTSLWLSSSSSDPSLTWTRLGCNTARRSLRRQNSI